MECTAQIAISSSKLFPNISSCTKWSINKSSQNVSLFLRLCYLFCEHQFSLWVTPVYKIQHTVYSVIETSEKNKHQTKIDGFKQNFYKARINFLIFVSITTHFQNNFRTQTSSFMSCLFFLFHEDRSQHVAGLFFIHHCKHMRKSSSD